MRHNHHNHGCDPCHSAVETKCLNPPQADIVTDWTGAYRFTSDDLAHRDDLPPPGVFANQTSGTLTVERVAGAPRSDYLATFVVGDRSFQLIGKAFTDAFGKTRFLQGIGINITGVVNYRFDAKRIGSGERVDATSLYGSVVDHNRTLFAVDDAVYGGEAHRV